METQIKKLIELSEQIISYLRENEILLLGWNAYSKNIRAYLSMDGNGNTAVEFIHSFKGLTVPNYHEGITIGRHHTATTLEELYNLVLSEFEDFKTNKAEEMKAKAEREREDRIITLTEELARLKGVVA